MLDLLSHPGTAVFPLQMAMRREKLEKLEQEPDAKGTRCLGEAPGIYRESVNTNLEEKQGWIQAPRGQF